MRFVAISEYVTQELARLRADLLHADSASISNSALTQERAARIKASTYVWLAALLERTIRDALREALSEISSSIRTHKDLRLSLFSLVCHAQFDALTNRARLPSWVSRTEVFARTISDDPVFLSGDVLPLDGRTIRAEHFDTIHQVLGITADSLPSNLHRIALKDLADGRNEVAHGRLDAVTFGRRKATRDVLRLIDKVGEVILHLLIEIDSYLASQQFRR